MYYEMWNETNVCNDKICFYSGSVSQMYQMTLEAYNILQNIDSNIKIIAPNVSIYGYQWLEDFLAMGGGNYVDIISYHDYQPKKPELSIPKIQACKDIIQRYGVQNKPLWDTEGNVGVSEDDPDKQPPTVDEAIAAVSRTFIVQWLYGVSNFNVYCYEGNVEPNDAQLSIWNAPHTLLVPQPPSIAYKATADWLIGSKVVSKSVVGSRWLVQIKLADNSDAFIVWDTDVDNYVFNIPAGWKILQKKLLNGNKLSYSSTITSDTIGFKPILLVLAPVPGAQGNTETVINEGHAEKTTSVSCYPNPFFTNTTIEYQLGEDTKVDLSVYDIYGGKISELVNSTQVAGKYNIVFNAEGLSNGVYFIQLKTNKDKVTSKMILIK